MFFICFLYCSEGIGFLVVSVGAVFAAAFTAVAPLEVVGLGKYAEPLLIVVKINIFYQFFIKFHSIKITNKFYFPALLQQKF